MLVQLALLETPALKEKRSVIFYSNSVILHGKMLLYYISFSPQGDIGPRGFTGLEGPWGDVGEQGERGLKGAKGQIGLLVSANQHFIFCICLHNILFTLTLFY